MKNKIIINGHEFQSESDNSNITISGTEKNVQLLSRPGKDVYSFSVDGKIYVISTAKDEEGNLKIYHDGNLFEIESKTAKEELLEKYMIGIGSASDKTKQIKAPMPGLVVKINCAVGDQMKKGDKPIVIEAMKMENALSSPGSGTVKSINVSEGQAVEKNTLLIELD